MTRQAYYNPQIKLIELSYHTSLAVSNIGFTTSC
uniref:Uncharacterized protein n=1 Tax=Rhizophora mucronata TaxID=61149 RepID=A0A2P2MXA6_RHIMU